MTTQPQPYRRLPRLFSERASTSSASDGSIRLSKRLAELLVEARETYAWPAKETAAASQQRIIDLESETCLRIQNLDPEKAHWIVQQVSMWGGNNARAQRVIEAAMLSQREQFAISIKSLSIPDNTKGVLQSLSQQPGLRLVMATKLYRFCSPECGAALDRHCSYFFNSLRVRDADGILRGCTLFKREWADGKNRTSRLAVYTDHGHRTNLDEYVDSYLPLLRSIADQLNSQKISYLCAASSSRRRWRPADVDMAAYQWWSRNANAR
jgi:hypothetical protein